MTDTVLVGLMSLVGTVVGTLGGILTTQRLTNYKIEELQKAVDKHNSVIVRTYNLEKDVAVMKNDIHELKEG